MKTKNSISWHYADLHAHIIPGVDDGANTIRDSLIMLDQAYDEGVRLIVCTPHYGWSNPNLNQEKVQERFKLLSNYGKKIHPDMELFLGNELYYKKGIIRDVINGKAYSMAGTKAVLVEFDNSTDAHEIDKCVHEFTNCGFTPVIAHIERYENLIGNLDIIAGLREIGAAIQVNSTVFILEDNHTRKKWAVDLLKSGNIDIISTDCHNYKNRRPVMNLAVEEIINIVGEDIAFEIINNNVWRILKGEKNGE